MNRTTQIKYRAIERPDITEWLLDTISAYPEGCSAESLYQELLEDEPYGITLSLWSPRSIQSVLDKCKNMVSRKTDPNTTKVTWYPLSSINQWQTRESSRVGKKEMLRKIRTKMSSYINKHPGEFFTAAQIKRAMNIPLEISSIGRQLKKACNEGLIKSDYKRCLSRNLVYKSISDSMDIA